MREGKVVAAGGKDNCAPAWDGFVDFQTGLLKRNRVLLQQRSGSSLCVAFGPRAELLRRLHVAESLLKDGFDPNQARDEGGRWTSGGGTSRAGGSSSRHEAAALAVGAAAIGEEAASASLLGEIGATTIAGLEAIGAGLGAAATLFLGVLFIPIGRSSVSSGELPGEPDIRYHYDGDTGHFTLYGPDKAPIFHGTDGGDGIIRAGNGDAIGRRVQGSVVVDWDSLARAVADGGISARTNTDSNDPKLCPDPWLDVPGYKSPASKLYQAYINWKTNPQNPLPPGLAVYLVNPRTARPVSFDDCELTTGDFVEAKGWEFRRLLLFKGEKMATRVEARLMDQARRQVAAAGSRHVRWYFAEVEAADRVRALFARDKELSHIEVIYEPMRAEKRYQQSQRTRSSSMNLWENAL